MAFCATGGNSQNGTIFGVQGYLPEKHGVLE
jgi:hypothetical protein